MRRFILGFLIVLLLPYVTTLAWSGAVNGLAGLSGLGAVGENGRVFGDPGSDEAQRTGQQQRRIYLEGGQKGYLSVEDYLPGLVAEQIPAEYELEALKAQAIIARTYIYGKMGDEMEIDESRLNLERMEEPELVKLWGQEHFTEYYKRIKEAVKDTEGMALAYEGQYIDPLFHRVSAGSTRNGDEAHPYLQSVESSFDLEAEDYLSVTDWTPEEFAERTDKTGGRTDGAELLNTVQIVEKDEAGYVLRIQIGAHVYTGEQVQEALRLPSPAFSVTGHEGNIRTVCRGIGHGLGLSQYGASRMAEEGKTASEILQYYYKNVDLILPEP